jgi:hypothetical protein
LCDEDELGIDQLSDSFSAMAAFDSGTAPMASKDFKRFASGNARQTLAYAKDVTARIAQNYKQGLLTGVNVSHAHLLNYIGQHVAEQSVAQRAHEVLVKVLPSIARYEQIRWAANQLGGRTPAQTAARVTYMVSKTNADDAMSELEGQQAFVVDCRTQYYSDHPDEIPPLKKYIQKVGQPDPTVLEEVDYRPAAAFRASVDTWNKLTPVQSKMFTLPAAWNVANLDAALLAVQFPAEYDAMRIVLETGRDARSRGDIMPTLEHLYWKCFIAQMGKPTTGEKLQFMQITASSSETLVQWSTHFYINMEATVAHLTVTPESLSLSYMAGVKEINSDLYHGILNGWPPGVTPVVDVCRDQVLSKDKVYRDVVEHGLLHSNKPPPRQPAAHARQQQANYAEQPNQPAQPPRRQQQQQGRAPQHQQHQQQQPRKDSGQSSGGRDQQQASVNNCPLCDRTHQNGICFILRPDLALQSWPGWKPPRDPYLYDVYRSACNKYNVRVQALASTTPAMPAQQQAQQQQRPPVRPQYGNQQRGATAQQPAANSGTQSYNATAPPSTYASPSTNNRDRRSNGNNRQQANMAEQLPASPAVQQPAPPVGESAPNPFAWSPSLADVESLVLADSTCFLTERLGSGPSAFATTRQQTAAKRAAPDHGAEVGEATGAVMATSKPAIPSAPVRAAVGPALPCVAPVIQPVLDYPLYDDTRRKAVPTAVGLSAVPRVVPKKPAPVPFATTAVPADTPLSQLPDTVRAARQLSVNGAVKDVDFSHALPTAARSGAQAISTGFRFLMQQGTGVLENCLTDRTHVMVRQGDGMYLHVPIDQLCLDMDLPSLAAINDASQQVTAAMTGPKPESSLVAAPPVASEVPAASLLEHSCMSAVTAATLLATDAAQLAPACLSVNIPHVDPPVIRSASLTEVPAVITLPYGDPQQGLSIRRHNQPCTLPFGRALLDTGANMVICSQEWADEHQLSYEHKGTVMQTSSGSSTSTVGMLTTPILFVLCAGTHAQLAIELPVHVMKGVGEVYDLLLGTPFTNPIHIDIHAGRSSASYCYRLLHNGDSESRHTIRTVDTALNPSAQYLADLQ